MTGVTITFNSESSINILNSTGGSVDFNIYKLLTTGSTELVDTVTIGNGANDDYDFTEIGFYIVLDSTSMESNTILIYSDVLDELETDVKEVLLADDIQKVLPKGYDFINLVLLSIAFLGNTGYQNVAYNAGNLTAYTAIATAFDRCTKYLDRQNNTPQSTNKVWQ